MWKVLVAEDDAENRKIVLDALKNIAECSAAATGQEALDLYQKSRKTKAPFDFALLDVTMPQVDGFEVLKAIRQEEERSNQRKRETLVIMITAYRDSLMEKYNMGWDDFITKPVEASHLIDHMKNLLLSKPS
jgi:CheY-like chemotaxis protein